jgi:transposase
MADLVDQELKTLKAWCVLDTKEKLQSQSQHLHKLAHELIEIHDSLVFENIDTNHLVEIANKIKELNDLIVLSSIKDSL